jgi:hypothetical protein
MDHHYIDKKILFPPINSSLISFLKIDYASKIYISEYKISSQITNIILSYLKDEKKIIVTDATAGVGGNSLTFGLYVWHVNSVEIDYQRSMYLGQNAHLYHLDNLTVYYYDYLEIMNKLIQDVIFLDPPWGGSEYKFKKNVRCLLSEIPIEDLCLKLREKTKLIALKLPLNYDLDYLKKKLLSEHYQLNFHIIGKILLVIYLKL